MQNLSFKKAIVLFQFLACYSIEFANWWGGDKKIKKRNEEKKDSQVWPAYGDSQSRCKEKEKKTYEGKTSGEKGSVKSSKEHDAVHRC